jgi:hypothetical protein
MKAYKAEEGVDSGTYLGSFSVRTLWLRATRRWRYIRECKGILHSRDESRGALLLLGSSSRVRVAVMSKKCEGILPEGIPHVSRRVARGAPGMRKRELVHGVVMGRKCLGILPEEILHP